MLVFKDFSFQMSNSGKDLKAKNLRNLISNHVPLYLNQLHEMLQRKNIFVISFESIITKIGKELEYYLSPSNDMEQLYP